MSENVNTLVEKTTGNERMNDRPWGIQMWSYVIDPVVCCSKIIVSRGLVDVFLGSQFPVKYSSYA